MEGDVGASGDLTVASRTTTAVSKARTKPKLLRKKAKKVSSKEKLKVKSVKRKNVGDGDCAQKKASKPVSKPKPPASTTLPIRRLKEVPRNIVPEEFRLPNRCFNFDLNGGGSSEDLSDEEFEFEMGLAHGANMRRFTSNDEPKPNLIINYLPQTLTDRDFFELFSPFGILESIKIMRDPETRYSFGYGFVNYFNLDEAIEARNHMNGLQLGHKRIKVSFARPPSDDIKDTNLFVTGLPEDVSEKELEKLFAPFGVIVHLRVLRDRKTLKPRGVAFVRFETRAEACAAIFELNSTVPEGGAEPIRVRLAQDHGKQKAAYLAGYQAALKFGGSKSDEEENPEKPEIPEPVKVETPRPPFPPPARPPTALPYPLGRPRKITAIPPSRHRPLSAMAVVGPQANIRGGPYGSLQASHRGYLLGSHLHGGFRLGMHGSLAQRCQVPKASTSISDQTLYWRGFLHGTREPYKTGDSLDRHELQKTIFAGMGIDISRLQF